VFSTILNITESHMHDCIMLIFYVYRVVVGKPEGMRPLGSPRRRWEDNIKMDLQEVGGVLGTG